MKTINDMRGNEWIQNYIEIIDNKVRYAGMAVAAIRKTETHISQYFYNIISLNDFILGMIALSDDDFNQLTKILNTPKESTTELPYNITKGEWILIIDKIIDCYNKSFKKPTTYNEYLNGIIEIKQQLRNIRNLDTLSNELKELV